MTKLRTFVVFFCSLLWLTAIGNQQGDTILLDMRSGLSESRVRSIRQMPDGRMAIATTTTIDIFDGTHFTAYRLPSEEAYPLPEYMGNRQMNCDTTGLIWLINKQTLYVVDAHRKPGDNNPLRRSEVEKLMQQRGLSNQQVIGFKHAPAPPTPLTWEGRFHDETVTAYTHDNYGGLWIGTLNYGILYVNPQRSHKFHTVNEPFPYEPYPVFCSSRASRLSTRFVPSSTNCSYEESERYLFLGTLDGVLVVNSRDSIVATIGEEDGLQTKNVAAIGADGRGNIWVTTAGGGISRISVTGRDSFDIVTYGLLDGISTEGREFQRGSIYKDKGGLMTVGFIGGMISFHPDSLANIKQYVFHIPRTSFVANDEIITSDKTDRHLWRWLFAGMTVLVLGAILWWRKRNAREWVKTATGSSLGALHLKTSEDTIEKLKAMTPEISAQDEAFLNRLQQTVEQNVSSEDFSVQQLSEEMAMDRTVLYRRMQVLNLGTPSNYIKYVRMEVAARLLRETELPVNEIAMRTGFSNAKYFSITFKQTFGKSPKEYRSTQDLDNSISLS